MKKDVFSRACRFVIRFRYNDKIKPISGSSVANPAIVDPQFVNVEKMSLKNGTAGESNTGEELSICPYYSTAVEKKIIC